jgi:hypothetical protein
VISQTGTLVTATTCRCALVAATVGGIVAVALLAVVAHELGRRNGYRERMRDEAQAPWVSGTWEPERGWK